MMGRNMRAKLIGVLNMDWTSLHTGFNRIMLGLLAGGLAQFSWAADADPFFDLDLKEVLSLEITSVSKKPQTLSQAAAAAFVITSDDIRRSGATSIPDVLRMAPGIQVGQISSNAWAVSARGLDGRFTNKLLVLMDGRSLYTPTYSGVYWDVQDTILADIERIEIIRGPGASLWGANAVNGVINIITKSAAATQGGLASVRLGDEEKQSVALRYGGQLGESGHWRIYAKGSERDESVIEALGSAGHDQWRQNRIGFRTDFATGSHDAFTVQGDAYRGRSGESTVLNFLTPPYNALMGTTQKVSGGNLLGRWQREISATDSFTLQGYIDHADRDWPAHLTDERTIFDVDFQFRTKRFDGHDLVVGAGYRQANDRIANSVTGIPPTALPYVTFLQTEAKRKLSSVFIQDDITLSPNKLILTLGTKLEHNDYTGTEHQPNARLLWTPNDGTTVWGAVARAVRTPSRLDGGGLVNQTVLPPLSFRNPLPLPALLQGYGEVGSETLRAYEVGWKQRFSPSVSVDLAMYYNDYDELRTGRFVSPVCQPSGLPVASGCFLFPGQAYVVQPVAAGNMATGHSQGFELAADWRAMANLKFQLALSQFSMTIKEQGNAFSTDREGSVPKQQLSLRTAWNPRADTDIDLWLRHVGRVVDLGESIIPIPAYTELDLRLAFRPLKNVEVSLVGRNLLKKRHAEFVSEALDVPPMLVERSVYGQVNWKF